MSILTKVGRWLEKKDQQIQERRKCRVHELGAYGLVCRRCSAQPIYGKVAYQKGDCLWYVELPQNSKWTAEKMGGEVPRYRKVATTNH